MARYITLKADASVGNELLDFVFLFMVTSMAYQQEVFLNELVEYQQEEERNDDVTLVGLKV